MSRRPNIIFCHVDQLASNAIHAHGCKDVTTPNIDRILADGIDFRQAQSTYPLCCPNRAAWYTGRFPSESGVLVNNAPLHKEIPDLGQWLSARGYDCQYGGKWHVPNRDVSKSFTYYHVQHSLGEFMDNSLAQATVSLLENRPDERPLFLNIGFMNPHDISYLDIHKNTAFKLGLEKQLGDRLPELPPDYDSTKEMLSGVAKNWTPQQVALYRYYYFRMTEMVDVEVGRVYDAVFKHLDPENTVFIFSSDHGEMNGHRNRVHKSVLYDPSLQIPLAMVAPGRIPAGSIDSTRTVGAMDITKTILDYAGAEALPDMHHAHSFRQLAETGVDPSEPEYVVSESLHLLGPQRSFRAGDFKSIYYTAEDRIELFNTKVDPLEQNDLSADPAYAETRARHDHFKKAFEKQHKPCRTWREALENHPYKWCASEVRKTMTARWKVRETTR